MEITPEEQEELEREKLNEEFQERQGCEGERLNHEELEVKLEAYKTSNDLLVAAVLAHYEWLIKLAKSEKLISPIEVSNNLKKCLNVSCMRHTQMSFHDLMHIDLNDFEQMLKERNGWN